MLRRVSGVLVSLQARRQYEQSRTAGRGHDGNESQAVPAHFGQWYLSGITAADTATAFLGTSAAVASTSLELKLYRFAFATAMLLEAGKTYLLATVNASGSATTINRVGVISRGGSSGWDLNAPGETV